MPDYNEATVTAKKWQRARCVTITNPADPAQAKEVYFQEEEAVQFADQVRTRDVGSCRAVFVPGATIALLDPATGEPTGATITHDAIYLALYSLYIATAQARDVAEAGG